MPVSLVATVLNESSSIAALLDSILAQERLPDEVVIVDGGSRDGTLEALRSYAGRLPLAPSSSPLPGPPSGWPWERLCCPLWRRLTPGAFCPPAARWLSRR